MGYFMKLFIEGTVASDVAQATGKGNMRRQRKGRGKEDCPCKDDPMSEECQKKRAGIKD